MLQDFCWLGPTLFIYFINDTPEILKCFKTFADTKVYTANANCYTDGWK